MRARKGQNSACGGCGAGGRRDKLEYLMTGALLGGWVEWADDDLLCEDILFVLNRI
jgi:hypothetical protein